MLLYFLSVYLLVLLLIAVIIGVPEDIKVSQAFEVLLLPIFIG
jgi:hypothetical protein